MALGIGEDAGVLWRDGEGSKERGSEACCFYTLKL